MWQVLWLEECKISIHVRVWQRCADLIITPDAVIRQVSDIQAKGATVTWSAPTGPESENGSAEDDRGPQEPLSYEVFVSFSGKDGKYKSMYWWALGRMAQGLWLLFYMCIWNMNCVFVHFPSMQWGGTKRCFRRSSASNGLSRQVGVSALLPLLRLMVYMQGNIFLTTFFLFLQGPGHL